MSRTADWVIQKAFLHANRKATPPNSGTPKYNALLGIVDSMQKLWADEPEVDGWDSLYSPAQLAATVTATDTFALTSTIQRLSKRQGDYIRVTNGTNTVPFKIITAKQLYEYRYQNAVAQIGRNLKFSRAFTADSSMLGYNIVVPCFLYPDDIDSGTDVTQVDNPMWLAYMSAEEFIRNDLVRRNTKNDLLQLAANVMEKMIDDNDGQEDTVSTNWQPEGETWR